GWLGAYTLMSFSARIRELESSARTDPAEFARLEHRLAEVQGKLDATRAALASDDTEAKLQSRICEVEQILDNTDRELELHRTRLASWENMWQGREPDTFDTRFTE